MAAGAPVPRSEGRSGPVPRSEGRSGPVPRSEGRSGPAPRSEGRSGPAPSRSWRTWPPALRASVAFGIVGFVLLTVGFVSGATPILVAATTAGSLSLVSALIWRGQLIEAWRREHGRPTRDW